MRFVIDASFLGTENHLLLDDDLSMKWSTKIPESFWHFSGRFKDGLCLDTLLALHHRQATFEQILDTKIINILQTLNVDLYKTQYCQLLTKKQKIEHIEYVVDTLNDHITNDINDSYFMNVWLPTSNIFKRLQPSKININLFQKNVLVGHNKSIIRSFKPNIDGETKQIKYNRFGTRTGRLTVESGPSILLLNKEYRSMLESRFDTGNICQYDFKALEVRIILYESGQTCVDSDIYEKIQCDVFNNSLTRDKVKYAVIALLYGRSEIAMAKDLDMSIDEINHILQQLSAYFKVATLYQKVKNQFVKSGYITNKYGRRIQIEQAKDNIIFNSYIQSTGVDVTLFGFEELCQNHFNSKINKIIPLYLLHDALFFDVQYMRMLPETLWISIPGYEQKFPLKLEKIS